MYPYPLHHPNPEQPGDSALGRFLHLANSVDGAGWYMPLAALKWCPERVAFRGADMDQTFLSSGTTGALRSRSPFSEAGLAAYREAAVGHFAEVLSAITAMPNPKVQLISLIPPFSSAKEATEEVWPTSSLAFMVAAFGERWPLRYATAKTLRKLYKESQQACRAQPDAIILLGTALHWLAVLDRSGFALGANTWLLETGGTKGQYQELSRKDFYQRLCAGFGVEENRIISEYGSCELAAQAYDFCGANENTALSERRFRFRSDVKLQVAKPQNGAAEGLSAQRSGIGTMVLFDPQRVDLPYVFATEDRIELSPDGSFKLLGRVKAAPLKGCSLLAEDLPTKRTAVAPGSLLSQKPSPHSLPDPLPTVGERIATLRTFWQQLLASPDFRAALEQDMTAISGGRMSAAGVQQVVNGAIFDLEMSFLASEGDYLRAIAQIVGNSCRAEDAATGREGERWLMVLPSSHPIAGLYPLTMAAILGIELEIRASSRQSFQILSHIIKWLCKSSFVRMKIITADADYQQSLDSAAGVMVFGHDATIALFRQRLAGRQVKVNGFGTANAGTVVAGPPTESAVAAVVKDIVSLAGQGCLASRFVGCADPSQLSAWLAALDKALAPFRQGQSPEREVIGRWLLQGFEAHAGWGPWRLLMPSSRPNSNHSQRLQGEALTSPTGDMIPMLVATPATSTALAGLKKLALAPALLRDESWTQACTDAGIELCPLGELNANPITGRHLGINLF